jgi:hypothetical protein
MAASIGRLFRARYRPLQPRDHAGRQCSIKPERIADGEYLLAHSKFVRIAERDDCQTCCRRLDLDHGNIGVRSPPT